MTDTQILSINPVKCVDVDISVPPSKSYTNRALITSALAEGTSILYNPSQSTDVEFLKSALSKFGVHIESHPDKLEVTGTGGILQTPKEKIYIGNAGTAMRFLCTFACLAEGETVIYGDEQMHRRPIKDLLDSLTSTGIKCSSNNGYPPVTIQGGVFRGGRIDIEASISSQFVSSLLLSAPYAKQPTLIHVKGKLSSMPYVDMSIHVMRSFGADVNVIDEFNYHVSNEQKYIGREFHIEADASAATYFMAAAAITGGKVFINNLPSESFQGDIKFANILAEMGCKITKRDNGIEINGGKLKGIEVDMNAIPDCVPTIAIVAVFADRPTTISNIPHLKYKETDRLKALCTELSKIGVRVEQHESGITIHPRQLNGAVIETYNDHRIAMSFAVAGLKISGISIKNPSCVSKSFPNFWEEFKKFEN